MDGLPILVDLDMEGLFINIPAESFARHLAATAQRLQQSQLRVQPMHLLQFTRFGSRLEVGQENLSSISIRLT